MSTRKRIEMNILLEEYQAMELILGEGFTGKDIASFILDEKQEHLPDISAVMGKEFKKIDVYNKLIQLYNSEVKLTPINNNILLIIDMLSKQDVTPKTNKQTIGKNVFDIIPKMEEMQTPQNSLREVLDALSPSQRNVYNNCMFNTNNGTKLYFDDGEEYTLDDLLRKSKLHHLIGLE